jgi:hypothetical protein
MMSAWYTFKNTLVMVTFMGIYRHYSRVNLIPILIFPKEFGKKISKKEIS